jgi:rod shape-determining protein MreC
MVRRGNRRTNSVGPIIGAVVLTALVTAAVTMLVAGNRYGAVAGFASDVAGAFGRVISVPVGWVQSGLSGVGSYFGGAPLNQKLKEENASLLQWRDQARAMVERLDAYEKLNNIAGETMPQGLSGRMIGESLSVFSRAGIVNLGSKAGVKVNWIVLNQNGLVGRVIAVGTDTSRVLLLGDSESRVPVMGEVTRARAIASGDKSAVPRLAHLNTPAIMRDGERVMTSGDDGIFPRGIAVGQAGIAPDKVWRVRLATNASAIDFVRLIPPSNFPPPLEAVTAPTLAAPPGDLSPSNLTASGAILTLAPGATAVPSAATPEAIRAAQTDGALALAKKLAGERDAAREIARKAEAARLAGERGNGAGARQGASSGGGGVNAVSSRSAKTGDANSAQSPPSPMPAPTPQPPPRAAEPAPVVEGPN